MKVIFAGTPAFAVPTLSALINSAHEVVAVYTQPDRPAGRGLKLQVSPVKQFTLSTSIPIFQPLNLNNYNEEKRLRELDADIMVVVAYGLLLPKSVLDIPRYGCINVHPSLLPRWRGAAPIQRAILTGDEATGITIMQMDTGLDTGAILYSASCSIQPHMAAEQLHNQLAEIGAQCLLTVLDNIHINNVQPLPQDDKLTTYAAKINKADALIKWSQSAAEIDRQIRAFNPWPVAYTTLNHKMLRIWRAAPVTAEIAAVKPGTIIRTNAEGIDVATKNGVIRLLELQLAGKKRLPSKDFLNAQREFLQPGTQPFN